MGVYMMCSMLIAFAAGTFIYYSIQDRKEAKARKEKESQE